MYRFCPRGDFSDYTSSSSDATHAHGSPAHHHSICTWRRGRWGAQKQDKAGKRSSLQTSLGPTRSHVSVNVLRIRIDTNVPVLCAIELDWVDARVLAFSFSVQLVLFVSSEQET